MQNLPLPVDPTEANEMFEYADKDKDNKARKESVKTYLCTLQLKCIKFFKERLILWNF